MNMVITKDILEAMLYAFRDRLDDQNYELSNLYLEDAKQAEEIESSIKENKKMIQDIQNVLEDKESLMITL